MMSKFMEWVDARFPATKMWEDHLSKYYAPKNFNFFYFFGSLALLVLVNQIVTGIWLTMSYTPSAEEAFASVEYIMRDVEYGWILRYLHSTGASAFFVVVYLHMFRGLLYGSYQKPRELVWIFGMLIYLMLMAEAFMGYLLPWGQMSYWGAQVIISLFGAIPVIGADLTQWIRGDYLISGITLNRFFALHVVALPIVILGLVVLHILALHEVGSNNPDGVDIKKKKDENGVPLDGIAFPSEAWTTHGTRGLPTAASAAQTLPNARGAAARLFAFGHDAWLLAAYLERLAVSADGRIEGATGTLRMDGFGNVQRTPAWSTFRGGVAVPL